MGITIGIDQSTRESGFAIFSGDTLLRVGCISSNHANTLARITDQASQIKSLYDEYHANLLAIEDIYLSVSAKTLVFLAQLQGAIYYAFRHENVVAIHPSRVNSHLGLSPSARRPLRKATSIQVAKYELMEADINLDISDHEADAIHIGRIALINKKNKILII